MYPMSDLGPPPILRHSEFYRPGGSSKGITSCPGRPGVPPAGSQAAPRAGAAVTAVRR